MRSILNASNSNKVTAGLKGLWLYLMPTPVFIAAIIALIKGDFLNTLLAAASFSGFILSAIIARRGFKQENQYKQKHLARAPRLPFKTVAASLLSITTGATAFLLADYGLLSSVLMGSTTLLGFYFYYGLDPRRNKVGDRWFESNQAELFEALEAAEIKISAIEAAKKSIGNIEFDQRLNRIINKARNVLAIIADDPGDLSRSRKFLKVYLDGTQRVTESYAKTHKKEATTEALDANFFNVLESIEKTFDEQHNKLLKNDQFDLDVKIEVLKTQLKQV